MPYKSLTIEQILAMLTEAPPRPALHERPHVKQIERILDHFQMW